MTVEEKRAAALNAAIAYVQLKRKEVIRNDLSKISEAELLNIIESDVKMFEVYIETGTLNFM